VTNPIDTDVVALGPQPRRAIAAPLISAVCSNEVFPDRKTITFHLRRIRIEIYNRRCPRYSFVRWDRREGTVKNMFAAGVAITAIMAAAGSVRAADLPFKAVAPIATYDWSGMYIGGVLGGAWGTNDFADPGLGIVGTAIGVPVIQTTNSSGFIGGVEGAPTTSSASW
jgi:hypothetical protein